MEPLLAVVIGGLFAAAIYMLLRRSIVKAIIGLSLLSHAGNLLIFSVAGMVRARPPIVPLGLTAPVPPHADPIPQALILTAIVISFGVLAFTVVLVHRTYQTLGTDDFDQMNSTDT